MRHERRKKSEKKKYKGDADETKGRKWVRREILFNIGIWIGKGERWNGENGKWEEGCNGGAAAERKDWDSRSS